MECRRHSTPGGHDDKDSFTHTINIEPLDVPCAVLHTGAIAVNEADSDPCPRGADVPAERRTINKIHK